MNKTGTLVLLDGRLMRRLDMAEVIIGIWELKTKVMGVMV